VFLITLKYIQQKHEVKNMEKIDERINFWRNQLLMVNSQLFELYQQRLVVQNMLQELELLKRQEEQKKKLEEEKEKEEKS